MRYTKEDGCAAWLASASVPPEVMADLLAEYGTAEAIYESFTRDRGESFSELLKPACLRMLLEHSDSAYLHQMLTRMRETETGILTVNDDNYPERLLEIPDPPQVLFYIGDPGCLEVRSVSMVGSRKPSVQGLEASETVARELALAGITIVSGLAMGIDAACHEGCISGGMPTVAVLGCGTDVVYPAANAALRRRILNTGGVLLSEYPPGVRPDPWHFPVRNRIISGLSEVTVMMEAKIRSGSMTTVRHALDQGREVYAYPGVPGSSFAEGAHQLLREGANYFSCANDILEDMAWSTPRRGAGSACEAEEETELTESQERIMIALAGGDMGFDELVAATGLSAPDMAGDLTVLEVYDLVHALPGKLYHRTTPCRT